MSLHKNKDTTKPKYLIIVDDSDTEEIINPSSTRGGFRNSLSKCDCNDASLTSYCKDNICAYDFAGNFEHVGFWADWCPHSKTVYFGGGWWDVPNLVIDHYPSESEVADYAFEHTSWDKLNNIYWVDEDED